ncbi:CRISPR-associated helicase, Cas3 family [Caloranaerobacter azorensis DSM 13643]|uniref:CRISPR-associated helicase, Cas3 family n=1 Tax=Caloranaerobacter azorensis DSM 13643 TaxID=1121264 RepID=A0A1M5W6D3_9FIRM|nr:CRISPR-associated helicase/endonuclease Cas3 [Caloranaerobacter azorensis]SHH83030.1 CRISPR-associated helicase, Cas3 family [Caloranaerobacter azorensis DSM 13643]
MNNLFLAKTKDRESIVEHTKELLFQFNRLKSIYPNIKYLDWEILRIACIYHDLGKMNTKFQNKLYKKMGLDELKDDLPEIEEIPHGYLSPAFLPKKKLQKKYSEDELRVLYQSIYYHHNRPKLENSDVIKRIVKEDLEKWRDLFEFDEIDKTEKLYQSYSRYVNKYRRIIYGEDENEIYYKYILTKGLLNKLDYSASAHIPVEEPNRDLFQKTLKSIEDSGYKLNELQQYMIKNQDKNNVIIASTGIGKTEAALFWIGNNKGFFTLPLRVSINAIYDRVKDKIGFEHVALLHSDTYSEYLKRNDDLDIDYYEKTKQFSMPLTICTLDQLIDFIFKYEGFELKLATLAYSKLVIDEIQMYSPDMIGYLIVALKYITEAGGRFSIVTATLPQIILDFMKEEEIEFNGPVTYCKKEKGKVQIRHKIEVIEEDININHVVENWKDKKVLIIVNTVKKAQEIYDELIKNDRLSGANINLLHSRFIKKHRALKEREILKIGDKDNKESGIWVTTQVVEASLDIDFDVLYTELSDISGLFQRMGRVYRSRTLKDDVTNVYVYTGKDKYTSGVGNSDKSIIDPKIFQLSKEAIKELSGQKLDEELKMKIVQRVYSREKLEEAEYYKKIRDTINKIKNIREFEIEKADVKLRNILNVSVVPMCVYYKDIDFIKECENIIKTSKDKKERELAKNDIKDFIVDIPLYMFEEARRNGRIVDYIELGKFNRIPVIDYNYSFEIGLKKDLNEFDIERQFL